MKLKPKLRKQVAELKTFSRPQRRRMISFKNQKVIEQLWKLSPNDRKTVLKLKSNKPRERMDALTTIKESGLKESIPLVETTLKDESESVRMFAIETLISLDPRGSFNRIEKKLKDVSWKVRIHTVGALFRLDRRRSIPLIREMLKDRRPEVKSFAAEKLAEAGERGNYLLYRGNILDRKFTEPKRSIVRRKQEKTGHTVLLGGRLKGKVTVRVMENRDVWNWINALEAGIPVEPIAIKNDKYRIYPVTERGRRTGKVRVFTGVIDGVSARAFLNTPENKKHEESIMRQMYDIEARLKKEGIEHGDLNRGNFMVEISHNQKGTEVPKVYVIDFDRETKK